jgi:hypothetical protein
LNGEVFSLGASSVVWLFSHWSFNGGLLSNGIDEDKECD